MQWLWEQTLFSNVFLKTTEKIENYQESYLLDKYHHRIVKEGLKIYC